MGRRINIDQEKLISDKLQKVAQLYYDSPATTNAGRVLRWLVKWIPKDIIIQIFSEKLKI